MPSWRLRISSPREATLSRDELTEHELAERAGTTVERVRQLVDLGLVEPHDGTFPRRDVMRVRVVEDLKAKGMDADALASAVASGHLTLGYLESAGRRFPRIDRTFEQFAEDIGVQLEVIQAVYVAFGLPRPHGDEFVREEDAEMIQALPVMLGEGIGEGDLLRAVRVWGDGARRVAQFQSHYFHHTIEEPFRRQGMRDNEAFEAAIMASLRMGHSAEQMMSWLVRRHSEAFFAEHQFLHVETALEEAGIRQRPPKGSEAAAFADLSGYTKLTEEAGDDVAAQVSLTLAVLVSEVAEEHRGEVVKMLGDGVHFHFRDPGDAVRASLQIVDTVAPRGLPPAHVGVNAGPMIYDGGDYFGRTVNIAARISAQAAANQVFVGEDLVRDVEPRGYRVQEVGRFELKGIARPVTLFEAVRDG
jgi:adenylate cyclase